MSIYEITYFERENRMKSSIRNYDAVDIAKFICAILIIILHTNPFPEYANIILPITHIAVPFFFIVGAFFLWKKIDGAANLKEKKSLLKKYLLNILKIYFVWFLITLPITFYARNFFEKGFVYGILYLCREFIFHSTWRSSWYLMATVIGTTLTFYYLEIKQWSKKIWLLITLCTYVFCVLASSYGDLVFHDTQIGSIYEIYRKIFTVPYTSFPVSFFWIYVGICLARNEKIIAERYHKAKMRFWGMISVILLLVEAFNVYAKKWVMTTDDCYFMLVPVSIVLTVIVINKNCNLKASKKLRKMSMLIYCMQGSFVELLGGGLKNCVIITLLCIGSATFILVIQNKLNLRRKI